MSLLKQSGVSILLATIWVSFSEFVRNEWMFNTYWTDHYQKLGLVFPAEPVNGAVWGLWSLLFAISVFIISRKFSLLVTTLLSWFMGFVLMWVVTWNMGVLPIEILLFAVPLSLFECYIAALIVKIKGGK